MSHDSLRLLPSPHYVNLAAVATTANPSVKIHLCLSDISVCLCFFFVCILVCAFVILLCCVWSCLCVCMSVCIVCLSETEGFHSTLHGSTRKPSRGCEVSPGEWSQSEHSNRGTKELREKETLFADPHSVFSILLCFHEPFFLHRSVFSFMNQPPS